MKPDSACGGDMEGEDWLPQQLFQGVGFLILEARTPHGATAKGRVEGPHCPSVQQEDSHVCCPAVKECRRADLITRQMELLWRNGIPMCIEVALYPDCSHGWREADSAPVEAGASGMTTEENRILLERWNIHVVPKRHGDNPESSVTPRFLLQAVRSYLHFSQLSAWLCSTKGHLPNPIAYRLFAPGESGWDTRDQSVPDRHSFPQADISQVIVKVSVESLPRVPQIPVIICRYGNSLTEKQEKTANRVSPPAAAKLTSHKRCALNKSSHDTANNNNNTGYPSDQLSARHSLTGAATVQRPLLTDQVERTKFDQNANGATQVQSAKPKVKLKPLEFEAPPVSKPGTKAHNLLSQAKRKDSPKVLITSSSSTRQTFYRKRYIDFDSPDQLGCNGEPNDWSAMKLSSQMSPYVPPRNAAEELEAYLATIAERNLWRDEQLKQIPVTKCKFYIGDNIEDCQSDRHTCSKKDTADDLYNRTPKVPIKKGLQPQTDLCKTLFKDNLSDLQRREKSPSGQRKTELSVEGCADLVAELAHIGQTTKVAPSCGQDFKGEATRKDKVGHPSVGNGHNCDTSPVQTSCKRFDKIQSAPAELADIDSNCASYEQDVTQDTLNGVQPESVISNGARVSRLPTPQGLASIHNAPVLSTKGEQTTSQHQTVLRRDISNLHRNATESVIPSQRQISNFRECLEKSASMMFNTTTGLPSRSSPAPIKKKSSGKFDYDSFLTNARAIKNAISCSKLSLKTDITEDSDSTGRTNQTLSTSAPASTNSLLGNFEESVLNGRIEPIGVVEGFTAEIGASGSFCPKHMTLPVTSYFFSLSDDNAPSPYLGHINLDCGKRKGYHVPKAGTVQVTLFNPNKTVVKMFVVRYDLSDMPPNCQTFLRQRTLYTPVNKDFDNNDDDECSQPSFLRYLIHLRFVSSKTGKIHLHTDIRLIFARDKFEFDPRVANYELRSYTEGPKNPKFSPKR